MSEINTGWHQVRRRLPLRRRPVLLMDHYGDISVRHPRYVWRYRKSFADLNFKWRYTHLKEKEEQA